MLLLDKQRAKHKAALAQLNAQHRAWAERARAARQRAARLEVREKLEAQGKKVVQTKSKEKKAKDKVAKGKQVVETKSQPTRGRPVRWPGLCHACMMRHLGEVGGPAHRKDFCDITKKHISKLQA